MMILSFFYKENHATRRHCARRVLRFHPLCKHGRQIRYRFYPLAYATVLAGCEGSEIFLAYSVRILVTALDDSIRFAVSECQ
jgi:hypothetical protein